MNITEQYWNILNNVNEWIRFSDNKAIFILTTHGVLLTILYSNSQEVLEGFKQSNLTLCFSLTGIFLSVCSIFSSLICLAPKIRTTNNNSVLFFGSIKSKFKSHEEYQKESTNIISNETYFQSELSQQIYINSKIASRKFTNVIWSIRFFVSSIFFFILAIATYLT